MSNTALENDTEPQINALKQIKGFISTARALFDEDGIQKFNDFEISKFYTSKQGHSGTALESLAKSLAWRKAYSVDTILEEKSSFESHDMTGKIQFYGQAMDRSDVIIVTYSKFETPKTALDVEMEARYVIFSLERAKRDGLLDDKVSVIVDLDHWRAGKSDLKVISTILPILQNNYPELLSRIYLFPTTTMFNLSFKMVNYFLDPSTQSKIHSRADSSTIAEWISRDQYFTKFGGLALDPFASLKVKSSATEVVLKTALIEESVVTVEELFVAPSAYLFL